MPLDMPESVLVRFKGKMQPGITLRDLVNAIPYYAIKQGLLTVEKKGKKNIFSGRILEIEGLPDLKVEQAFELSDASAERSAAACTVHLNKAPIIEYMRSNITLMKWMIANGYEASAPWAAASRPWKLDRQPELLKADAGRRVRRRDRDRPGRHQGADRRLPERPGRRQAAVRSRRRQDRRSLHRLVHDQHRPLPRRRQGARRQVRHPDPPVDRPADQDGRHDPQRGRLLRHPRQVRRAHGNARLLAVHGQPGADRKGSTAMSTSTRNFPNRLGIDTRVYLGSAELAAICALMGKIPTVAEYMEQVKVVNAKAADVYRYMNFDQIKEFSEVADTVTVLPCFAQP
jgi:aconitate hydratase 2/2-methylisocitrate dehydratase